VAKEIEFQIGNTISEHPTLRRVHKRFRQELEKRHGIPGM
jgi:hypothetical protein